MPPSTYQVIAEVSAQDPGTIDRIQRTLSLTFNIDLAAQRAQLRQGGVTLCQVATLEEARKRAQQARDAGADFRIVASDGRVVLEGAGRASTTRAPSIPAPQAARQSTQLGGYQPANAVPPPLSTDRTDPLAQTQPSSGAKPAAIPAPGVSTLPGAKPASPSGPAGSLSGAGRRTIPTKPGVPSFAAAAPRPSSPATGPAAAWKPDTASQAGDDLDFLDQSGQAAPRGSTSPEPKALDELNADDLVLLDGTSDASPAPPRTGPASMAGHGKPSPPPPAKPAAPAPPPPKAPEVAQLFGDEAFAPPAGEDEALELDEQVAVRPSEPPAPEDAPPPDAPPVEDDAPLQELVQQRAAPPPPEPAAAPAAAPRPRPPRERRVPLPSFFSEPPARLLFGGWFRQSPRLRIVVGFALALGLGSILPTCHAGSVVSKRIKPQLEDLSTSKAHGPLIAHLPNYRSPGQIEQDISDIKTRHGIYCVVIWLICSSLLGFAWFRYS
jgi:hypothetical protein